MKTKSIPQPTLVPNRPAPLPPTPMSRRFAPIAGGAAALVAGLLLRQLLGGIGIVQYDNIYSAMNVAGVLTLGVALSFWVGRLSGRIPPALVLGGLAGIAAACFAHEIVPGLAGLVIIGLFGIRFLSRILSWAMLYLVALLYGAAVGLGTHYLITTSDSWTAYPQAGVALLIGVGIAAYLASCFGEEESNRRFASVWNTWIRANRLGLVGAVMLGLAGSLYGLRGQDLHELANQIRTPVEEKIAEFKEVSDKVEAAHDFKSEVDRILGGTQSQSDE